MAEDDPIPLMSHDPAEAPVFLPGNLLEAARTRKGLATTIVPEGCLLDFDGELVGQLVSSGRAVEEPDWPCFHTRLFRWRAGKYGYGVIAGTVGAPFAVLVAEELFASGCGALVSISSAGLVSERFTPPFFLLIDRALRDEGTSHHYMPPGRYAEASPAVIAAARRRMAGLGIPIHTGRSWTTDAPFRETESLISRRRREGIISVEMEAAALLAMGKALGKPVVCLAHVTNNMATREEDFEKGGKTGLEEALKVCEAALEAAVDYAARDDCGKRENP